MRSTYITPFQSDTLMGVIAWTIKQLYGEDELIRFIEKCKTEPPFVISNGFPDGYLPKLVLPTQRLNILQRSKVELMQEVKRNKRLKDRQWLRKDEYYKIVNQLEVDWGEYVNPIKVVSRIHNIINRTTGQSLEKNGLYELEEYATSKINIFVKYIDLTYQAKLEEVLEYIGKIGYGAKKSIGKGIFELEVVDEDLSYLLQVQNFNGYVVMSNFIPSSNDSLNGYYKVFTKYGKVGEELAVSSTPHKYPILMIGAGASFYSETLPQFTGTLLENVSPQHQHIVHFGFGLTLPIKLAIREDFNETRKVSI